MKSSRSPSVHWLGTGLSSLPGLRKLAQNEMPLHVWNRTLSKAEEALSGFERSGLSAEVFDRSSLNERMQPGDVVISMLPASLHPEIARICLENGAHLVTASYLSTEMRDFHAEAVTQNLCFVNEIGLDPGLDHLMAYEAVNALRQSPHWEDAQGKVHFKSLCGGLSEKPNEFRYRFSWSPSGVLKALKNQAVFIKDGKAETTQRAWTDVEDVLIADECFEAYPNRDSLPFIADYDLDHGPFQIESFVRGTLRLKGWKEAWEPIFTQVEAGNEMEIANLSDSLWKQHALPENENDRVVLFVSLQSQSPSHGHWCYSGLINEIGRASGSAMAILVSLPVAYVAERILSGDIQSGVTGAPKDPRFRDRLFRDLGKEGVKLSQKVSWTNASS